MLEERKDKARAWFEALQGKILAAFEKLEDECPGPFDTQAGPSGRAVRTPWQRRNHDGAPGGGGYATARAMADMLAVPWSDTFQV